MTIATAVAGQRGSVSLNGTWVLRLVERPSEGLTTITHGTQAGAVAPRVPHELPITIPGDVHTALQLAGVIDDPYWRDNELAVDWVDQQAWSLLTQFDVDVDVDEGDDEDEGEGEGEGERRDTGRDTNAAATGSALVSTLVLEGVDCFAEVLVNDVLVGCCDNQFVRFAFDVGEQLQPGTNTLELRLGVARNVAAQAADDFPFVLPWLSWNSRVPHVNQIRKTPCHAGWDWNICLMPIGVYGGVSLEQQDRLRIEDLAVRYTFDGERVSVHLDVGLQVHVACTVECRAQLAGTDTSSSLTLYPGQSSAELTLDLDAPARWWPVGSGHQNLHMLVVEIAGQCCTRQIGIRETRLRRTPDASGSGESFSLEINGQPTFMRGANWIPSDALPGRESPEALRELLQSAVDANMNMIRVWGGGQYESDAFYSICDELGLLVWQDFMFSCNHYPAANPVWLDSVRVEARQQVRRLSRFACLALWCGDNELVGALDWWELTRRDRDRYLANYVRLNTVLEETVRAESPDLPWWPSSPSKGLLDFGDGWKNDAAGDMHFWDVWHEAKPFSAYREVRPRFCSEFGFQSFPSMPALRGFTEPEDRNVSSSVMDIHQRNVGGNARIVETLVRHFRFPETFEQIVYLSQVQQAMGIATAVEYWRTLAPHCMGALYWQLNDTWPVASWSSLEYGGSWKLLHYAARRFFAPVLVAIVPDDGNARANEANDSDPAPSAAGDPAPVGEQDLSKPLVVRAVANEQISVSIEVTVRALDVLDGQLRQSWTNRIDLRAGIAAEVCRIARHDVPSGTFLQVRWIPSNESRENLPAASSPAESALAGAGEFWPAPYKAFPIGKPVITYELLAGDATGEDTVIELCTDRPAFFVSVELGGRRVWSDNGFTLLPGEPKRLHVLRCLTHSAIPDVPALTIEHL